VKKVHIRWMIRRDMQEVVDIEQLCFEYPWSEDDFVKCLRYKNCIGLIAEHGEMVVGYVLYELHKTRLRILNIAVLPAVHGQGNGLQMIEKLLNKLSQQRRTRISLEVRETNLDAQLFFKAMGFQWVETLKEYYENSLEDAYELQIRVPEAKGVVSCP
jgi:ribosomal-protein-alanine N-acetyltransferase